MEQKEDPDNSIKKEQPNNPLHGVKLLEMLEYLIAEKGWDELGRLTGIRAFSDRPTVKSCLKMLRKNDWARVKIEDLYSKSFARVKKGPSKK